MDEAHLDEAVEVLLEQLYRAVGKPPDAELVSEELQCERRKKALKEALDDE